MRTAPRDEYSVNAEHFASHLVSKRLGKARSFFHSFVLNVLERCFLFCFVLFYFGRASVRSHTISMFPISPELYDVVIVCEDGTELQCHKCILVAQLGTYGLQT